MQVCVRYCCLNKGGFNCKNPVLFALAPSAPANSILGQHLYSLRKDLVFSEETHNLIVIVFNFPFNLYNSIIFLVY